MRRTTPNATTRDPLAFAAAAVFLGAIGFVAAHDDLRRAAPAVIVALLVAGVGYGLMIARARRDEVLRSNALRANEIDVGVLAILGLGLVARLLMLVPDVGFSDDFYRYAWEGRVVLAGENPYVHAPDDPALASLRDESIWPRVTHRDVPAAYPPLAQAIFACAAATSWPIAVLRFVFLGCELLALAVIVRLLLERGASRSTILALVLAPLSIVEYAGAMHFDSAALALLALAWWSSTRDRPLGSALLLGLAVLAKPFPALLLPILLERRAWRTQLAGFAAVLVLGHLPFAQDGAPFRGLVRYAEEWTFNAPLFPALVAALATLRNAVFDHGWTNLPIGNSIAPWIVETPPERMARGVVGIAFVLIAWPWWWPRAGIASSLSREQRALRVSFALLACSPIVHPWYVTWLLPLAALAEANPMGRDRVASIAWLWAALAPLGYHVLPDFVDFGIWREDGVIRAVQYAPVLVSIAWVSVFSAKTGAVATGDATGVAVARTGKSDANPDQ